jgi:hypothetical protein
MSSGHRGREKTLSLAERKDIFQEAKSDPKFDKRMARPFRLSTEYDIPLLGSSSKDGSTVYLDRHLRYRNNPYGLIPVNGKLMNVKFPLIEHERVEQALEDIYGLKYEQAHEVATFAEHRIVEFKGFDPDDYEKALEPYIKADDHERLVRIPPDLDIRPELAPPVDKALLARLKKGRASGGRTVKATERIGRDAFLYLEGTVPDFAQCSSCYLFARDKGRCAILGPDFEVRPENTCGLYLEGAYDGTPIRKLAEPGDVGFAREAVRCENCRYGGKRCKLYVQLNQAHPAMFDLTEEIQLRGCCNAWISKK